ncbi:MAG: hypothetical protein GX592_03070, partial [Clostridiales bacterium]|nr:hypothetical protein [Clostridiales bacterium]
LDASAPVDYTANLNVPAGMLLANIVADGGASLTVTKLVAPGFNLLLLGGEIAINGQVSGKNVLINSTVADSPVDDLEQSFIEDDLSEEEGDDISVGLYEASASSKITIASTASITAAQAIDILASLTLDKPFLPSGDWFNPLTFKLGEVKVDILGTLNATGSLRANAVYAATVEATSGMLKVICPLAVGAVTGDTRLTVGGSARLTSGYGIRLGATSDIHVASEAMSGPMKFSIAVAVVESDTHVLIGGNAHVQAAADARILARSTVHTEAAATGKMSDILAVEPQSGIFLAGTFVDQSTSAKITGAATVVSGAPTTLGSESKVFTQTTAVSIPAAESTMNFSMFSILPFVEKLLKVEKAPNQSMFGKIVSKATGSNSLGNKFTDGTSSAQPDTGSVTQVMGAAAVAYVSNENAALIDTTGGVTSAGALDVNARAVTVSELRADGSLYKTPPIVPEIPGTTPEPEPNNAVGVGIAVGITNHENSAKILHGAISARDLNVEANTRRITSSIMSKSGHIPKDADFGLGGAVTVHVLICRNDSLIAGAPTYTLPAGGRVSAISAGAGCFTTVADASGKRVTPGLSFGGYE